MVEDASMSERENIFARIREALPAIPHEPLPDIAAHRRVLPAVGASLEEQFALFAKNSTELHSEFRLLHDHGAMIAELAVLRDTNGWKRIASHNGELAGAACRALNVATLATDNGYDKLELEQCDAGLTECDALIAQTGSVLVTSRSAGGRALSVLPPHHVVLARREQLVPDLPAAFGLLKTKYAGNYPSMIGFITGPSRTGDIERILVLGAHGPKRLTILCF
jgi:L-lactate dehydrogenase complex protein LldG